MKKTIRSNYVKDVLIEKDKLTESMKQGTKEIMKDLIEESGKKILREALADTDDEDNTDSYTEEEVGAEPDTVEDGETTDDLESTKNDDTMDTDTDVDDTTLEDVDTSDDGDEVWNEIEPYKTDDGEYDLTGMDNDNVLKVLRVMKPEDGIRVVKNDNGSITLSDDDTDKEYVIDIEGSLGDDNTDIEDGQIDTDNMDIDVDVNDTSDDFDTDMTSDMGDDTDFDTDDFGDDFGEESDNMDSDSDDTTDTTDDFSDDDTDSDNVDIDMDSDDSTEDMDTDSDDTDDTDTTDDDNDDLDESINIDTDSMPNDSDMNEEDVEEQIGANGHQHVINKKIARNSYEKQKRKEYGYGHVMQESKDENIAGIKRMARSIKEENETLKGIINELRDKVEESIVINHSLAKVVKLVTENTTSRDEKLDIITRFNDVKSINEGKRLYEAISRELKNSHPINETAKKIDSTINEGKNMNLIETKMLKDDSLTNEVKSFWDRLNKVK